MPEKPTTLQWCVYALAAFGLHCAAILGALTLRAIGMAAE